MFRSKQWAHTYNSWEAEPGRLLQAQGRSGLYNDFHSRLQCETVSKNIKIIKNKYK